MMKRNEGIEKLKEKTQNAKSSSSEVFSAKDMNNVFFAYHTTLLMQNIFW